jgi:hypothetical protein
MLIQCMFFSVTVDVDVNFYCFENIMALAVSVFSTSERGEEGLIQLQTYVFKNRVFFCVLHYVTMCMSWHPSK